MANFKTTSRYANAEGIYTDFNKPFILLKKQIELEDDPSDVIITLTDEYIKRPDLISNNAYGTPEYWWIIYEYNNIQDPLFELRPGLSLKVPTIERVREAIKKLGE